LHQIPKSAAFIKIESQEAPHDEQDNEDEEIKDEDIETKSPLPQLFELINMKFK
jgi:hypothetical protein